MISPFTLLIPRNLIGFQASLDSQDQRDNLGRPTMTNEEAVRDCIIKVAREWYRVEPEHKRPALIRLSTAVKKLEVIYSQKEKAEALSETSKVSS